MKKIIFIFFCLHNLVFAQISTDSFSFAKYNKSFNILDSLFLSNGSFKMAVFTSERTFSVDTINEAIYNQSISFLKQLSLKFANSITTKYHWRDSVNHVKNLSIFSILTDTSYILADSSLLAFFPFRYSFTDPFGRQDWSNMFVTKLLATHQGNCHSLAYLYKILADEVGAKCWLALAPNHIYIKNYNEKIGWYNTELTSGTFPTDAWIMVTGYVNPEAIKSGLYMDTLSNQQSIALCILDLAKEYEFQTYNYYDGFILKCCNLVLQYYPANPIALLLKAETLKKIYLRQREMQSPKSKTSFTFDEMQHAYITLAKLGYREMPEKMYQQWLKEMTGEKEKYVNKKITTRTTKK